MITADQLQQGTNRYTGSVEFYINLISDPSGNNLELQVPVFYSSNVWKTATTWNLSAPTGVMGLGWSLGTAQIVVDLKESASTSDNSYYLLAGGESSLLVRTGTASDGRWLFETQNYHFWKIYYDPARELWQIIKEDGNSYFYGGQNSGRDTVQWGIAWENWLGSSAEIPGQSPIAVAWNLSQMTDLWGNAITYTYENVNQYVGSAPSGSEVRRIYTQASYLKGITGMAGNAVIFNYSEKDSEEYQDPHTDASPPNAYQSRFETRYLASVDYLAQDGTLLFSQKLIYDDGNGNTAFLGDGHLKKRLLTGIKRIWPNGDGLPGSVFAYGGQYRADGVNVNQIYNANTKALYGALKTVTLPEGGVVTYHYGQQTLGLSSRQSAIDRPEKTGFTYSNPRFGFGRHYTTVTWYGVNSDSTQHVMHVFAYTWEGRWLQADLGEIPVDNANAYDAVSILAEENFFAIQSGQRVYLYHHNPFKRGEWVQATGTQGENPVNYFTTAFDPSESIVFVAGDSFVAALGSASGKLYRWHWNGETWVDDGLMTLTVGGSNPVFTASAKRNVLVTSGTSVIQTSDPMHLTLFHLEQVGTWQQQEFLRARLITNITQLKLDAGESFMVQTCTSSNPVLTTIEYRVLWWDRAFTQLLSQNLGQYTLDGSQTPYESVVRGSTVAIAQQLYRFNGRTWIHTNLSRVAFTSGATIDSLSYGFDKVLRIYHTDPNTYTYDLVNYDPNTQKWTIPAGMSTAGNTGGVACRAARTRDYLSNFVLFNNKVYYRQPDGSWAEQFTIPDPLTGDDLNSLQLLESRYLIYQSGADTKVYPLHNGTVANASSPELLSGKIYVPNTSAAKLVGLRAFVTYTDTFGTANSDLNLYAVVNEQATGQQNGYGVIGILVNNGYQTVTTGFDYHVTNATVDALGLIPQFNKTSIVPGSEDPTTPTYGSSSTYFFNGLTPSETPALPYPSDTTYTNTQDYYSLVKGLNYAAQVVDSEEVVKSSTEKYWRVYQKTLGQIGVGTYVRLTQETPMLDNVVNQILNTYSNETGLVTQTSSRNYKAGTNEMVEEQFVQVFKYWWEVYDPNRSLNLLAAIVQTTEKTVLPAQGVEEVTGIVVITWKDKWGYGSGRWAPWQTFRALSADATFNHWDGSGTPDPNWLLNSTVQARTQTGLVTEQTNVDGVYSSVIVGKDGWLNTANFANANAAAQEANAYGFEPYEDEGRWGITGSNQTLSQYITTIDYYTGTRSLRLNPDPDQKIGPINQFQPLNQDRAYVFSCWAKAEVGFNSANGKAQWEITVRRNDNNGQVGNTLTLEIANTNTNTNTNDQWIYLQQIIELGKLRSEHNIPPSVKLSITIRAYNQNSSKYCLVDNLRFSAVDGTFSEVVYNPHSHQITAILGNNGQTQRYVYDTYQRLIAQVGPEEKVEWLAASSYSRDLTSDDRFLANFPNSTLGLRTTSDSIYYDFHDGKTANWDFTEGWEITNGELTYTPPQGGGGNDPLGGTATLKIFAFTNFAARVRVNTETTGTAGIGNGDVFVYWDGSASLWKLARKQTDGSLTLIAQSNAQGFGKDWIFAIVERFVMFYVNGVQLFSDTYDLNTSLANVGKPVLTLKQNGAFDDLLVLNNPELSVGFSDGAGSLMQTVSYEGYGESGDHYPTNGSGVFLDDLGRPAYQRNPSNAPLQLAPLEASVGATAAELLKGNETTYLVEPNHQSLTKQQYLDGASGVYDYTATQYEASPLSRVTATIMPRKTGAVSENFTVGYAYLATSSSGDGSVMNNLLPSSSENRYYINQVTNQNGVPSYRLIDQVGNTIAERTLLENGSYQTTFFEYDNAGRLTTVRQPNYYAPPNGSAPANWQETRTYNFLGWLTSKTTPDTGTTKYAFDRAGRVRFLLDANGAAQSPQRILYTRYDVLGRAVEEGYIQDSQYTWHSPTLTDKLNNQAFPNTEDNTSSNYAQGAWYKKFTFDFNSEQPDILNLLGRLYQVQINHADPGVETETYAYDARGNITKQQSQISGFDSGTYITRYTYDNLDNLIEINYPHLAGEEKFKVAYYYNRLGQLASVGDTLTGTEVIDPAHPADAGEKYYAAYTYNALGAIAQESLNNGKGNPQDTVSPKSFARNYSYTPQGWLTSIDDPYLTEALDYYQAEGTKYYNGNIASTAFSYKPDKWSCPPADYQYRFTYDNLNRLTNATNNVNNAWSVRFGPDAQVGYDANGNLAHVKRGVTTSTYNYAAARENQQNNQVHDLSSTAESTLSFDSLTHSPSCADGWCWGSSNGGPSDSAVVEDSDRGKVLRLAGGSLGHYESLRLQTYLDPNGTYTLTYRVKTDANFGNGYGQAAWVLRFHSDSAEIVTTPLNAITDTNGNWTTTPVSLDIDVASLRNTLGLGQEINTITLECINYIRSSSNGSGPPFFLDDISLAIKQTVTTPAYGYDANGNITAAPARSLTTLNYNPVTGLSDGITLADGKQLVYDYGSTNRRSLAKFTDSSNQVLTSTRYLYGIDRRPLLVITQSAGQSAQITRYIYGSTGLLAYKQGDTLRYVLKDHLGSTRSQVDAESGRVENSYDYLPFGGLMRVGRGDGTNYRYTGQEFDVESGLYNYNARLYDPGLRRFYEADPAGQYACSYAYVGNNPINRVDPTGEISKAMVRVGAVLAIEFTTQLFTSLFWAVYYLPHYFTYSVNPREKEGVRQSIVFAKHVYGSQIDVSNFLNKTSFELVNWYGSTESAQNATRPGLNGFLAIENRSNPDIYLAFRGSDRADISDHVYFQMRNASTISLYPSPNSPKVSNYFYSYWKQHKANILSDLNNLMTRNNSAQRIYITGHSLGATHATFAINDIYDDPRFRNEIQRFHLVTFGMPYIGDKQFAEMFTPKTQNFTSLRYFVFNDPRVSSTSALGLWFTSYHFEGIPLYPSLRFFLDAHATNAYLAAIENLQNTSTEFRDEL